MTSTTDIKIHDIAYGGDGVGRLDDGMSVFVPFTAIDETVRVEILSRQKRFARARVIDIVDAGRGRVEAPCPHYRHCGGCLYQHLNGAEQLLVKQTQLQNLLQRIGKQSTLPPVEGAVAAPQAYGYRNKATLRPLPQTDAERLQFGYTGLDNNSLVAIEACPLLHPQINTQLAALQADAALAALPAEQPLQPLVLRRDCSGNVIAFRRPPSELLQEQVLGQNFSIAADSFFQVNLPVLEQLVSWLQQHLQLQASANLLDAYCGVGVFACLLAELFPGRIAGIEANSKALDLATVNLQNNNARTLTATAGTVQRHLAQVLKRLQPDRTTVLLDPPRSGCQPEVLQVLLARRPKQLIYISCNPATFARDLAILTAGENAFRLQRLALFDMFPQTAHFEVVAVLH